MTFSKQMLVVVASLAGTCSAAGMEVLQPDGAYTQAPSGMVFPAKVDDFQRVNVIKYKPDGTDMSAGYNRSTLGSEVVATVYVFPSPSVTSFGSPEEVVTDARKHLCDQQFNAVQEEIAQAHPKATRQVASDSQLLQSGVTYNGHYASYYLTLPEFMGRMNVAVHSDVYLFCFAGEKWSVEYRIDYPVDFGAAGAKIAAFMRDLAWTFPRETCGTKVLGLVYGSCPRQAP